MGSFVFLSFFSLVFFLVRCRLASFCSPACIFFLSVLSTLTAHSGHPSAMPNLLVDAAKAKDRLVPSKPLTAITDWIDRICRPNQFIPETDLNSFIIELITAINLQSSGPEEASRAIRKQLKHGRIASQNKALVLLEALVLNGDDRFRSNFADPRLVGSIKTLVYDTKSDRLVRRRAMLMLQRWADLYRGHLDLAVVAGLFELCGGQKKLDAISSTGPDTSTTIRAMITGVERAYITQDPSKARKTPDPASKQAKQDLLAQKQRRKELRKKFGRRTSSIDQTYRKDVVVPVDALRTPELRQPSCLQVADSASQRATNLVNFLRLVDSSQSDLKTDTQVQNLLKDLRTSHKTLIRYIGLATDDDDQERNLSRLLNTNSQVVASLELHDLLSQPFPDSDEVDKLLAKIKKAEQTRSLSDDDSSGESDDQDVFQDPKNVGEGGRGIVTDLLGLDFNSPSRSPSASSSNMASPFPPIPHGQSDPISPLLTVEGRIPSLCDQPNASPDCSDDGGSPSSDLSSAVGPTSPQGDHQRNVLFCHSQSPSFEVQSGEERGAGPAKHGSSGGMRFGSDLDPFADPTLDGSLI